MSGPDYWPTREWRVSKPEEQGLSQKAVAQIAAFAADSSPLLSGIVGVRHGRIVLEQYFRGFHAESYHSLFSVTKSFISALAGIALGKGYLKSLDQTVLEYFPEVDRARLDPRVGKVTLRHLLTMTGGWDRSKGLSSKALGEEGSRSDPVERTLRRPMANEPGTRFWYDSEGMHLLSVVLTRATGMKASQFALERLFRPLGIWPEPAPRFVWRTNEGGPHNWYDRILFDEQDGLLWKVDHAGYPGGWTGLHLTLREMAKFGFLYLHGGAWDGEQIIPGEYVRESVQPFSPGGSGPEPEPTPYGYLWWVPRSEYGTFYAWGAGRQYIYVVPGLDLVLAVTAHLGRNDPGRILEQIVIPALETV